MTNKVLSRKATFAQGALAVFLRPKLATDAKLDFLPGLLGDVSAKNFGEKKTAIVAGITTALKDKLAAGMALDALPGMVDEIEKTPVPEGHDLDPNSGLPMSAEEMRKKTMDADKPDEAEEFLKKKLSAEDWAAYDSLRHRGDESEEEKRKREEKEATDKRARDADPEMKPEVTKAAMDQAIAIATKTATDNAIKTQNAIRDAEKAVRPYVGELALAFDSADAVYRTALKMVGVEGVEGIKELAALQAILKAQPLPGAKKSETTSLGMDAAGIKSYRDRFPETARIGHLG